MQQPHQLIAILHAPNPGIPSSIFESISKTDQDEDDWDNGIWRSDAGDNVADDFTDWCGDGDPELAEVHVDPVDEEGGEGVAGEWGEEDAGDDGVGDVVVCLELWWISMEIEIGRRAYIWNESSDRAIMNT